MRTPYELLICLTHHRHEDVQDARRQVQMLHVHGVPGCWTIGCPWCKHFHVIGPRLSRDQRRLLWFCVCAVLVTLATVGAMIFDNLLGFTAYLITGFIVAALGTFWQYGKL